MCWQIYEGEESKVSHRALRSAASMMDNFRKQRGKQYLVASRKYLPLFGFSLFNSSDSSATPTQQSQKYILHTPVRKFEEMYSHKQKSWDMPKILKCRTCLIKAVPNPVSTYPDRRLLNPSGTCLVEAVLNPLSLPVQTEGLVQLQ